MMVKLCCLLSRQLLLRLLAATLGEFRSDGSALTKGCCLQPKHFCEIKWLQGNPFLSKFLHKYCRVLTQA
jgi:hypothetical protein